jgi:hypothetical protein
MVPCASIVWTLDRGYAVVVGFVLDVVGVPFIPARPAKTPNRKGTPTNITIMTIIALNIVERILCCGAGEGFDFAFPAALDFEGCEFVSPFMDVHW